LLGRKKEQKSAQGFEKTRDRGWGTGNSDEGVAIAKGKTMQGGTPPHYMDEYQNKGLAKWAICKCMKRKHEDSNGGHEG
jgi:hypothetical protein